jgi:hypothetical protein
VVKPNSNIHNKPGKYSNNSAWVLFYAKRVLSINIKQKKV